MLLGPACGGLGPVLWGCQGPYRKTPGEWWMAGALALIGAGMFKKVVISSYLPEVMNLSDRILVCRQGRVVEEISPLDASEEKIMFAAVH